jgi:hypothetical protein
MSHTRKPWFQKSVELARSRVGKSREIAVFARSANRANAEIAELPPFCIRGEPRTGDRDSSARGGNPPFGVPAVQLLEEARALPRTAAWVDGAFMRDDNQEAPTLNGPGTASKSHLASEVASLED